MAMAVRMMITGYGFLFAPVVTLAIAAIQVSVIASVVISAFIVFLCLFRVSDLLYRSLRVGSSKIFLVLEMRLCLHVSSLLYQYNSILISSFISPNFVCGVRSLIALVYHELGRLMVEVDNRCFAQVLI